MKSCFVVTGHSFVKPEWAKERWPDKYQPCRAFCSCGAWGTIFGPFTIGARNWHDEHKIEVLRSRGELEEDDD